MLILANFLRGHPYLWVGMSATGVLSAFVIGATQRQPDAPLARALALRPLVWLGQRSYAMYLWYWPVFVVFQEARISAGWTRLALELPIVVALAAASWVIVEQPMMALGRRRAKERLARRYGADSAPAT